MAFPDSLSDSCKYCCGFFKKFNVVNKLQKKYSFTHTAPSKNTNFTAFSKRCKKVDYLNPGFQNIIINFKFRIGLSCSIYRPPGNSLQRLFILGIPKDVDQPAIYCRSNRYGYDLACSSYFCTPV